MAENILSGSTRIMATKEQVWCNMDKEAVILNTRDGKYYELNPVGADFWQLIQEPRTIDEITAMILEEYDVERDVLEQDLYELVHELLTKELVDIQK